MAYFEDKALMGCSLNQNALGPELTLAKVNGAFQPKFGTHKINFIIRAKAPAAISWRIVNLINTINFSYSYLRR